MFVIGDIHGELELLKGLYEKIKIYNEPIYQVGDIIDRGPYPVKCLEFVFNNHIIATMGNHELMFLESTDEESIYQKRSKQLWYRNGGFITNVQMEDLPKENFKKLREKINRLPYFIKTKDGNKDIVIMHAGMGRYKEMNFYDNLWMESGDDDFLWYRTGYLKSSLFDDLDNIYIVTGHTPFEDVTFDGKSRFIIDTGAFATGNLSAIRFNNGKIEKHMFSRENGYSFEEMLRS